MYNKFMVVAHTLTKKTTTTLDYLQLDSVQINIRKDFISLFISKKKKIKNYYL